MSKSMGEIISQKRQNRKMTQDDLAVRLGVTAQAVSKWERGLGLPDVGLLGGLCQTLDISADVLLGLRKEDVIAENDDRVMSDAIRKGLIAEPLVLEFGIGLVPIIAEGIKTDFINRKRLELAQETGMLLPILHIRDNVFLGEKEVRILSYDKVLVQYAVEETDVAAYQSIIEQVTETCREYYADILNKQLVKIMVDNLKQQYPGVADGLIPEQISYLQLQRKLQECVRTKGDIRDMIHIVEELEESI